jgi:DNA polymerase III subunit gamma/tau
MYLPLVRKYGVSHFDNIIGQPIVVKILRNTLFLDHLFPFYLFSGRHGCGKTSTARLFSAAINCAQLALFQKDPTINLPCLFCNSCKAMNLMQHPDFIEIDAASHTGVDNIRALIESATLLPLVGKKKIYLIDEAHMLSKAACNAFLKLLEEPPEHVVFILATTAPEKIIETVRSRAFQLLFHAIDEQAMCHYLEQVATKEEITYTKDGIKEMVHRGGGSVRDTLNLLDQANLAVTNISYETVLEFCGGISDTTVTDVLNSIFHKNTESLSLLLKKHCSGHLKNSYYLFEKIIEQTYHLLLFVCHQQHSIFSLYQKTRYTQLVEKSLVTKSLLVSFLLFLYDQEPVIRRVENPSLFLEIMILKWLQESLGAAQEGKLPPEITTTLETSMSNDQTEKKVVHTSFQNEKTGKNIWDDFLEAIKKQQDPLLSSVFSQAVFHHFDSNTKRITVHLKKEHHFFASLLEEHKQDWQNTLQHVFGSSSTLDMQFIIEDTPTQKLSETTKQIKNDADNIQQHPIAQKETRMQQQRSYFAPKRYPRSPSPVIIDVSDSEKWPYAQRVQKIFHGVITEVEKV